MHRGISLLIVAASFAWGCGGSHPPPTQPLADVQAADRSAKELGAADLPKASLHLKYAEDQTTQAKRLMQEDENKQAAALLMRAKADAELAVALAHEQRAKAQVQEAIAETKNTSSNPGVQP